MRYGIYNEDGLCLEIYDTKKEATERAETMSKYHSEKFTTKEWS